MCKDDLVSQPMKVTQLYTFEGLKRKECDSAKFGEIVAITGFGDNELKIGATICDVGQPDPIPYVPIDEPTLQFSVSVNNSPNNG